MNGNLNRQMINFEARRFIGQHQVIGNTRHSFLLEPDSGRSQLLLSFLFLLLNSTSLFFSIRRLDRLRMCR
jgi:hypothetical protein